MSWLVLFVLALIAYFFFASSSSSSKSNSKSRARNKGSSANQTQSFLPPIPKDHQIFASNMLVAGISFQKEDAIQFANGTNQTLKLERKLNNQHDKNAIKVIGLASSSQYFLGYVPKEISEQIIETHLLDSIKPRLARIYQGNNGYIEIQFQVIGLKEYKKKYDVFLENQPADARQKDFYKFFDLSIPKSLTTSEAAKQIAEHRKTLEVENASSLKEYEAYSNILDEFDDSDFRECCEVKKVSKMILSEALSQLKKEGKTYEYLLDNIDEVVERVIQLKPELERA
jgi:hypothetical protein